MGGAAACPLSKRLFAGLFAVLLMLVLLAYSHSSMLISLSSPLHAQVEALAPRMSDIRPVAITEKPRQITELVDNSKAKNTLEEYQKLFANSSTEKSMVMDPTNKDSITTWWQAAAMIDWYIKAPVRYQCKNRAKMGNWGICQDEPYTVKPPCLVYSFGINWEWTFDDDMGKLGCEVHSFDPSMKTADHKRNANVTFHNLGLGSTNRDAFQPHTDIYVKKNDPTWKVRTLKAIRKMLNHENRVIDVLKIDVEGFEWDVVENIIESEVLPYVRQFMLEWHLFDWQPKTEWVHFYKVFTSLREMGFREFHIGPHSKTLKVEKFNNQGDSEYVNAFFRYPASK